MKITVKHKDTEITIEESETQSKEYVTAMRYGDQNTRIQETLIVMAEQVLKLQGVN